MSVPEDVSKLLSKVTKCLKERITNSLCKVVNCLLIMLWTTEWPPAIQTEIHDPTIHYLALMFINENGSFMDSYPITNPSSSACELAF